MMIYDIYYYINKDHQFYRFNGLLYVNHIPGARTSKQINLIKNCLEPEALAEEEHASATVLKPNAVRSRK